MLGTVLCGFTMLLVSGSALSKISLLCLFPGLWFLLFGFSLPLGKTVRVNGTPYVPGVFPGSLPQVCPLTVTLLQFSAKPTSYQVGVGVVFKPVPVNPSDLLHMFMNACTVLG